MNKNGKYIADISTLDLVALLESETYTRVQKNDHYTLEVECPFYSKHGKAYFTTTNEGFGFNFECKECQCDFSKFLDLFLPDTVEAFCKEVIPPQATYNEKGEALKDSFDVVAKKFLERYKIISFGSGLVYLYNGKLWEAVTEDYLMQLLLNVEPSEYFSINRFKNIVKRVIIDATRKKTPKWNNLKPTEIPCKNGIVDIVTGHIRAFKHDDLIDTVINTVYDPQATCNEWELCLMQWFMFDHNNSLPSDFQGGKEYIDTKNALQEFAGYILMPHAKYKKCLILFGESNCGKSVVAKIFTEIVGLHNTCSIDVRDMGDPRKRAGIKGKLLNTLGDMPKDAMIEDGGFKQLISTGDPIKLDRKYKDEETYIPICKHMFNTNNLPRIVDYSMATFNRILMIGFLNVFKPEDADPELHDKLLRQKSGILNWMIEGAKRLYENKGEFTTPSLSKHALSEYRRSENVMYQFVDEFLCKSDDSEYIKISDMQYKYCEYSGQVRVSPQHIGKMLKSVGIEALRVQMGNARCMAIKGYKWAQK